MVRHRGTRGHAAADHRQAVRAANEALKSDDVVKSLQAQTVAVQGGTPADFRKHMEAEQKRWNEVVEARACGSNARVTGEP